MEDREKYIRLIIAGGLGNQLFQLAAALHFAKEAKILIIDNVLPVRKSDSGLAELFSFDLSDKIDRTFTEPAKMSVKVAVRIILRTSYSNSLLSKSLRKIAEILIKNSMTGSFSNRNVEVVSENNQKDLDQSHQLEKNELFIIGYFQSPIWMNDEKIIQEMNMNIQLRKSNKIAGLNQLAKNERPLVVHVRLTDYLQNTNFGIPSKLYYKNGIEQIWKLGHCDKIWLFSDDLVEAVQFIPKDFHQFLRLMDPSELTSSETLEVMKFGFGYVIANSSFSWWGAFLRHNQFASVIVPDPWFKGFASQMVSYPDSWIPLDAHYPEE